MGEETWKKGRGLLDKMPELKTKEEIRWSEKGAGENLRSLCTLLKVNAIPTKKLDLTGDEKRTKRERIIKKKKRKRRLKRMDKMIMI